MTKAIVLSGEGINCEYETQHAFQQVGIDADIVHLNKLIANPSILSTYQILAFPGGFSSGDYIRAGRILANKIKEKLTDEISDFFERDTLTIGVCNGFQALSYLNVFPIEFSLIPNNPPNFINRWIDVEFLGESPWFTHQSTMSLPIAHAEGRFYVSDAVLPLLKKNDFATVRYTSDSMVDYEGLAVNPNGSLDNIAGITNDTGRVLGLMPHPERATFFSQLPQYYLLRAEYDAKGKQIPSEGPGLTLFKNAAEYFK